MTERFDLTFDYLCPFARIANETVVEALEAGADWDVGFRVFSLSQTKVEEGETPVWERPPDGEGVRGVKALQWAIAVRDRFPDRFHAWHLGAYEARFTDGADLDDEDVLRRVATSAGLDPHQIEEIVATGEPLDVLAREHTELVKRWAVFGVPTFIRGDEAVFVRLMERHVRSDVEQVLSMLEATNLNEFKRTRIPR
ncbi:MAG: DsbA family protein [Acidimicrobiia bacterium]